MEQEGKNDTFEPNAGIVSACKTSNDTNTSVGQIKTEIKPKSVLPVKEEEVESNASASGCIEPIQNPNLVLNCELTDSQGSHCNKCKSQVETMYHCTVCNNFDLCLNCKQKERHPHIMEKFSLDINNASLADAKKKSWKFSAQKYMNLLAHACRCKKILCSTYCEKMKKVVIHVKNCEICIINGDCSVGKQFNGVCCHHARHCELVECEVPFCKDMKNKLKEHQIQQAQLQNGRMDVMMNREATGSNTGSATDHVTADDQQQQQQQEPEQQQQEPSIHDISRQLPRQLRVNDNPMIQLGWTPANIRALHQLKEVLRMPQTIEQNIEILYILCSNPSLIAIISRQRYALVRAGLTIGNRLARRKVRNAGS